MIRLDLYIFKGYPVVVVKDISVKDAMSIVKNTNLTEFKPKLMYDYFSLHKDRYVYVPKHSEYAIAKHK